MDFDALLRQQIYTHTTEHGKPPALAELSEATGAPQDRVRESLARLATGRILVLQPESHDGPIMLSVGGVEERKNMLRSVITNSNVVVDSFNGLLVDFATAKQASLIVRGIRAASDYETELQMALMNHRLQPKLETVFLMSGEAYSFVSSRLVKEVARLGGDVSGFVPPIVLNQLLERFKNKV